VRHYLLFYAYAEDYLERRTALRPAHLQHAREAEQRGALLLGGAVADPLDSGLLWFQAESADLVEAFARADPYVVNGLVRSWRVREWLTVVGAAAASPLPAK
jgi:uncharacterized protein YciI